MYTKINEPNCTTHESMLRRLRECSKRWLGQRSQDASITACEYFIRNCLEIGITSSLDISQRHIDAYKLGLENRGLAASTINTRLVAVKAYVDHCIGYARSHGFENEADFMAVLKFSYKTRSKQSKWHMSDNDLGLLHARMPDALGLDDAHLMTDYINWTCETGLRVEETLRLLPGDFEALSTERPALLVPGTKNEQSAIRIPISMVAAGIILKRQGAVVRTNGRVFDVSYAKLRAMWQTCRTIMGVEANPTATLKALRRNFAANALRKGLPARIIQELMRHSNIETTMSYLRLIGMSDNDETRALLNRQLGAPAGRNAGFEVFETSSVIRSLEAMGYTVVKTNE